MFKMIKNAQSFDPIWEEKYSRGHQEKSPWDNVVSFIYRYRPRDKEFKDIKLLEVGCGTGSNLWFAALEGFDVTGLDGSKSAIETAKNRLKEFSLKGQLDVGNFTDLPYEDNSFDMIIDRGALCCCGRSDLEKALSEVHRVLKPSGKFFHTPFSKEHTSYTSGEKGADDLIINVKGGTLTDVGQILFVDRQDIDNLFSDDQWKKLSIMHETKDYLIEDYGVHAAWTIVAEKI